MTKSIKLIVLTILSVTTCLLAYRLCYFVAEKLFFDKFFYHKSISHGYTPAGHRFNYADFGDRGNDLLALEKNNLLHNTTNKSYVISVIGDSHVWGTGIRNDQRFAKLLQNKLNHYYHTIVYSFGKWGYNTLDYYNIYKKSSSVITSNLYIIVPVTNDAVLNDYNLDDPIFKLCQAQYPDIKPVVNSSSNPHNIIEMSWSDPINLCVVNQALSLLPASNIIFLVDKDYHRSNPQFNPHLEAIGKNHQTILSTDLAEKNPKYSRYFDTSNIERNFNVSSVEPHPNALANQMYADILFAEVTSNSKWGFTTPTAN